MPPVTRPSSRIHQLLKCCAVVRRGTGIITNGIRCHTFVTQDKAYMAVYARHSLLRPRRSAALPEGRSQTCTLPSNECGLPAKVPKTAEDPNPTIKRIPMSCGQTML